MSVNFIRETGEALRSQMAEHKTEVVTRVRVAEENNDQTSGKYLEKIDHIEKVVDKYNEKIDENKQDNKDITTNSSRSPMSSPLA